VDNAPELQWISLGLAVIGACLTALKTNRQRKFGFICFLLSNMGWFAAGYKVESTPLMLQSVIFSVFSSLGLWNNRK